MKKQSAHDRFMALSDAEKEREVAPFNEEFVADKARPLTPEQRRLWQKAQNRKPGRPMVGKGVKVIALSVEKDLLRRADTQAKREGISRAQFFARGVQSLLASA